MLVPAIITYIYDHPAWLCGYSCGLLTAIIPFTYIVKHYLDEPLAFWPRYPVFFLFIDPGFLYPAPFGVESIRC
jgi:hypothetical protein